MTDTQAVQREIEELHRFFQAWLTGDAPRGPGELDRCAKVLAPGFTLITPVGHVWGSAALLEMLQASWGSRPGFRLWVEDTHVLVSTPETVVARYVEHQHRDGSRTARLSTAVFLRLGEARQDLAWLTVHETWMAPSEESP